MGKRSVYASIYILALLLVYSISFATEVDPKFFYALIERSLSTIVLQAKKKHLCGKNVVVALITERSEKLELPRTERKSEGIVLEQLAQTYLTTKCPCFVTVTRDYSKIYTLWLQEYENLVGGKGSRIGELLHADYFLTGYWWWKGHNFYLDLALLDARTGQVIAEVLVGKHYLWWRYQNYVIIIVVTSVILLSIIYREKICSLLTQTWQLLSLYYKRPHFKRLWKDFAEKICTIKSLPFILVGYEVNPNALLKSTFSNCFKESLFIIPDKNFLSRVEQIYNEWEKQDHLAAPIAYSSRVLRNPLICVYIRRNWFEDEKNSFKILWYLYNFILFPHTQEGYRISGKNGMCILLTEMSKDEFFSSLKQTCEFKYYVPSYLHSLKERFGIDIRFFDKKFEKILQRAEILYVPRNLLFDQVFYNALNSKLERSPCRLSQKLNSYQPTYQPEKDLDEDQRRIVLTPCDQSLLVVAPPGSGKTTYVIYEYANKLKKTGEKSNVLFLAFNRTVKEKAEKDLKKKNILNHVYTFHGFGYEWLFGGKKSRGVDTSRIIEEFFSSKRKEVTEIWQVFLRVKKELEKLDVPVLLKQEISLYEKFVEDHQGAFSESLSQDFNFLTDFAQFLIRTQKTLFFHTLNSFADWCRKRKLTEIERTWYRALYKLWKSYEAFLDRYRKKDKFVCDFDDMLCKAIRNVLAEEKSSRRSFREFIRQYDYFFVDEFQDVDLAQLLMIEILTTEIPHFMVIGDEDQLIYEWRGANPEFFLNFRFLHPYVRIETLKVNYRCPKDVMDCAIKLIKKNKKRFCNKEIKSFKDAVEKGIKCLRSDEKAEVNRRIVDEIINELKGKQTLEYQEMVLIARTNKLLDDYGRALKEKFEKEKIPFAIAKLRGQKKVEQETFYLSTPHTAKGLTFNKVFLETARFYPRDDIESERRTLYVALTRAKEKLVVSVNLQILKKEMILLEEANLCGDKS